MGFNRSIVCIEANKENACEPTKVNGFGATVFSKTC